MIDEELIHKKIDNTIYVHETFSSMFHGMLNWFQNQFEPRFAYKVISTYDKAVQFFKSKKMAKDGTIQTNILPSITLDPNLDFTNEERSGKFLWMFSHLNSLGNRPFCYKLNLRDQGAVVSVMHTRYSGTCDVTFWLSSIYELMDFRTKIIQFCGGTGRWIRPEFFWSHIVLPKEIVEFNKTADNNQLDWSATPLEVIQLSTTNSKEYAVPYPINAIWRLDSLSDGSTKYGADQLTEWRFTATFTWEANIPTYVRLDNFAFNDMKLVPEFHLSPVYAAQPLLDKIPMVDFLTRDKVLKDIINTNHIFCVDTEEVITNTETNQPEIVQLSPFVKFDETQCQHYPISFEKWNHVVSGSIMDNEYLDEHPESLNSDFILLIDRYNPELHDTYLRRAKGCLCRFDDESSEFYTKITALKLSTICHFDAKLYKALKKQVGNDITMDSICKLIYSGIHSSRILDYNCIVNRNYYDVCNYLVTLIQNNSESEYNDKKHRKLDSFGISSVIYNKTLDIGRMKKGERSIELPELVSSETAKNLVVYVNDNIASKDSYDIIGKVLTFNEKAELSEYPKIKIEFKGLTKIIQLELMTNYLMTKADEKDYLVKGKKITIEIPEKYDPEYIRCCSYNGILHEHFDFEINDRIITFKLEPMRDKVIQVFANRNYN